MMSINGKIYTDLVKFPVAVILENEKQKNELIEEYRYLCDEEVGKLLEYSDALKYRRCDLEDYKYPLEIDKVNKMIEWIEWQFDLWSKHLRVK